MYNYLMNSYNKFTRKSAYTELLLLTMNKVTL